MSGGAEQQGRCGQCRHWSQTVNAAHVGVCLTVFDDQPGFTDLEAGGFDIYYRGHVDLEALHAAKGCIMTHETFGCTLFARRLDA